MSAKKQRESAEQIVSRLLEDFDMTAPREGTVFDPDHLRTEIERIMRTLGVDYPTARDVAMSRQDPSAQHSAHPVNAGHTGHLSRMEAVTDTKMGDGHCGRCGSKRHETKECRLLGIPI